MPCLPSTARKVEWLLALGAVSGRSASHLDSTHAVSAVPIESCVAAGFLFLRRLDEVATIGQVLALRAGVEIELRALARRFDLPRETLRGWWDRFRARSPTLLAEVVEVAIGLDTAPLDLRQTGEAVVFEALDQTLHRARRRFGEQTHR